MHLLAITSTEAHTCCRFFGYGVMDGAIVALCYVRMSSWPGWGGDVGFFDFSVKPWSLWRRSRWRWSLARQELFKYFP